jgi:hypothetical protein
LPVGEHEAPAAGALAEQGVEPLDELAVVVVALVEPVVVVG